MCVGICSEYMCYVNYVGVCLILLYVCVVCVVCVVCGVCGVCGVVCVTEIEIGRKRDLYTGRDKDRETESER